MAEERKDNWSTEAYQHSASFVPKLATRIMQWLDPQKDDVILDIGCGDGVLNIQIDEILSQGNGSIHGTDASPAMIEAATQAAQKSGASRCTFEGGPRAHDEADQSQVVDALHLSQAPHLQRSSYTKVFSNAALHWVLGGPVTPQQQTQLFHTVRNALRPGGTFVFEMGGLGNVSEMRAALLMAVARRVGGLESALRYDPWFFPDEVWMTGMLEKDVGGWKVERVEREWRPTTADEGGVEGWVRLFGARFFEVVPEGTEREECVREVVDVLEVVCRNPGGGGFSLGYVRLRVLARKA